MKRFSTGLISGLLIGFVLATNTFALAGQQIKLIINGQEVQSDVPPQNVNGRILVPARCVAEQLGATVKWDANNQAVVINKSGSLTVTPTTTMELEKQEVKAWIEKTSGAIAEVMRYILEEKTDINGLEQAINDLKMAQIELKGRGTLDEYIKLKEIYLDIIDKTGAAGVCQKAILKGDEDTRIYIIKRGTYMDTTNELMLELTSEIESLTKKGLL